MLGSSGAAIAIWEVEGVRSLFGKFEGCDSEARPRNRCLGKLERCDRFWGVGKGAIAVWEVGGGAVAIWEV